MEQLVRPTPSVLTGNSLLALMVVYATSCFITFLGTSVIVYIRSET